MREWKRMIAMFLAVCLLVTSCPMALEVWADGTPTVIVKHSDGTNEITLTTDESISIELTADGSDSTKYTVDSLPSSLSDTNGKYKFSGKWYSEVGCSTEFTTATEISQNTTIYAQWTENATFKVTFDANGGTFGSSETQEVTYYEGQTVTAPTSDPTREADVTDTHTTTYTFAGWGTADNSTTANAVFTNITSDTTFYAVWSETTTDSSTGTDTEEYTVTFYPRGGQFSDGANEQMVNVESGEDATEPTVTREGFKLLGWSTSEASYDPVANITKNVSKDLDLYAVWEDLTVYTFIITVDLDGGSWTTTAPSNFDYNISTGLYTGSFTDWDVFDKLMASLTATKEGYYTTGQTLSLTSADNDTLYYNYVYGWGKQESYTITFNANGGKFSDGKSTQTLETGNTGTLASLLTVTHDDELYTFDGWYTSATGTTKVTTDYVFTANTTIYAQWDDGISKITISEKPDKVSYTSGEKIDPEGLEIVVYYDDGTYETIVYDDDTEANFSFSPSLNTTLSSSHSSLTVGYLGYTASVSISVDSADPEVVVNVEDHEGDAVKTATAKLYQGTTVKYSATNNADGSYTFAAVEAGTYNLVVTYGDHVRTTLVTVSLTDKEYDIELTEFAVATSVENDTDFAVLTVDGLDELAQSLEGDEGEIVTVTMYFDDYVTTTEKDMIRLHKGTDEIIAQIFDVSLSKITSYEDSTSTDKESLHEVSVLLSFTFEIDEDYEDRSSYTIYRYHDDAVEKLTTSKNSSGEYISVDTTNNTVTVYTKKFSPYALVVNAEDGEEDTATNTIKELTIVKTLNHNTSTSDTAGTVVADTMYPTYGTNVYFDVTCNVGYTIAGMSAVDSLGNKLNILKFNDTRYYFVQLLNPVTLTVDYIGTNASTAPSSYQGFFDVGNTAYYFYYVYRCRELGLMDGVGNGLFQPEKETTRAEVAQILYKLAGTPNFYAENTFSDVSAGAWYVNPILWAKSVGVIMGYEDGTFRPDDFVTREEIAVMFFQYAGYAGINTNFNYTASYNDYSAIGSWAQKAVNWCTYRGLFTGYDGNIYVPSATSRRCDVAVSLVGLHALL